MRSIKYYIFLLFVTSSCASNSLSTLENVTSWQEVEAEPFNDKILKSYNAGLAWARKPELYVFNLFDITNLKHMSYEYSADNIEEPKNIKITIIRDGFLDDSVRGDIQRMNLAKNTNGIWEIKIIKKAVSCWRTNKVTYSAKACP